MLEPELLGSWRSSDNRGKDMFELPHNWDELNTLSEIFKNSFEALALIGGAFALWKWLAERKDRATDILLKLEHEFCRPKIVQGRQCVEDDERYDSIKHQLQQYADESSADGLKPAGESPQTKCESPQEKEKILADCQAIDALLRF